MTGLEKEVYKYKPFIIYNVCKTCIHKKNIKTNKFLYLLLTFKVQTLSRPLQTFTIASWIPDVLWIIVPLYNPSVRNLM